MEFEIIDSLNHPQARLLLELLRPEGRRHHGLLIIDDAQNILQATRAGLEMEGVYCTDWEDQPEWLHAIQARHYQLSWRTAKKIFEAERNSRTFALAVPPPAMDPLTILSLPGDVVILDQLALAGNAGAIIRTSLALGAAGLLLIGDHDLTDRRLIRASRGLVFHLRVAVTDRQSFLRFLERVPKILSVAAAGCDLEVHQWASQPEDRLILLGSEKYGAGADLSARAQERVAIPMDSRVESLNVSVAAAILLYARLSARRAMTKMEP